MAATRATHAFVLPQLEVSRALALLHRLERLHPPPGEVRRAQRRPYLLSPMVAAGDGDRESPALFMAQGRNLSATGISFLVARTAAPTDGGAWNAEGQVRLDRLLLPETEITVALPIHNDQLMYLVGEVVRQRRACECVIEIGVHFAARNAILPEHAALLGLCSLA